MRISIHTLACLGAASLLFASVAFAGPGVIGRAAPKVPLSGPPMTSSPCPVGTTVAPGATKTSCICTINKAPFQALLVCPDRSEPVSVDPGCAVGCQDKVY